MVHFRMPPQLRPCRTFCHRVECRYLQPLRALVCNSLNDINRMRFVRYRSGKLDVCRELGITHFVDDRAETLEMLRDCVEHRFLFGSGPTGDGIIAVGNWAELSRELRRSMTGIPGR